MQFCSRRVPNAACVQHSSSRNVIARAAVTTKTTLYEKLGGQPAVIAAVDKFYEKVLADDRVKTYFQGTDMAKQRAHQAAFMTMAFGGPNAYKGKDMAAAHRHLIPHLEELHFNAIVEHFVATLQELDVPQEDIDAAVSVVATTKDAVLSK